MLILPVRPQPSHLHIQENPDSRSTSSSIANSDSDLRLAPKPPVQQTDTMISIMPSSKLPTPKRPKLSLQTFATVSSAGEKAKANLTLSTGTETPIRTSTYANAFAPSQTPTSCVHHVQEAPVQASLDDQNTPPSSTSSSATSSSSGHSSPFPVSAPYSLPIGAHSILRNSPLPRKHLSVATRINRRRFLPVKRVMFREILEDIIPAQIVGCSSDSSDSDCGEKRQRATFEKAEIRERQSANSVDEGAPSTPVNRRRKRRREWVWRPLDDGVLTVHHVLDEDNNGCHSKAGVNLTTSANDIRPVELEIDLPIVSDDAYSRPTIELSCEKDDGKAGGTLIFQDKLVGTELELQKDFEVLESWVEAVTTNAP